MNESLITEKIINARNAVTKLNAGYLNAFIDKSILDAYNIQKNVINGTNKKVVGWKLGGTNKTTKELFNVSELYWGPVFEGGLKESLDDLSLKCGEVEIAFRLSENISGNNKQVSLQNLNEYVSEVCFSVEFPWSVFETFGSHGVLPLIADCCASGEVVLGKKIQYCDYVDPYNISMFENGKKLYELEEVGLLDTPEQTLVDFINKAKQRGFNLQGDQWVFTGGITACQSLEWKELVITSSLSEMSFN